MIANFVKKVKSVKFDTENGMEVTWESKIKQNKKAFGKPKAILKIYKIRIVHFFQKVKFDMKIFRGECKNADSKRLTDR